MCWRRRSDYRRDICVSSVKMAPITRSKKVFFFLPLSSSLWVISKVYYVWAFLDLWVLFVISLCSCRATLIFDFILFCNSFQWFWVVLLCICLLLGWSKWTVLWRGIFSWPCFHFILKCGNALHDYIYQGFHVFAIPVKFHIHQLTNLSNTYRYIKIIFNQ